MRMKHFVIYDKCSIIDDDLFCDGKIFKVFEEKCIKEESKIEFNNE